MEAQVWPRSSRVCVRSIFELSAGDDSVGYYIQPTVILTKDPRSITMRDEIFGPVMTV